MIASSPTCRYLWPVPAVLLALVVLGGPVPVRAQNADGLTLTASAGFDGYYRDGDWVPIRVSVANTGEPVEAEVRIAVPRYDGSLAVYTRPVSLPTQSNKQFMMFVAGEGYLTNIKVRLLSGENELASTTARVTTLGTGNLLFGVVAGSPSAFHALADVDPVTGAAFVAQMSVEDLPGHAHALKPADVLVFSDVDTGTLTDEQRLALKGWVGAGGRLVVVGGPGWQKTIAGLAEFLPVQVTGLQTLAGFPELGIFAGSGDPLDGASPAAVGELLEGAQVRVSQDGVPLIVARRMGYGQVDFIAIDPSASPFSDWDDAEGLYRNLLANAQDKPSWSSGFSEWYQAAEAVYTVPGLDLPSAIQLCGFLALYVVAVGPLNYLVLRRAKRRELAWLTIPALVVVFSLGAYFMGSRIRGDRPVLHRLSVVQVWPESDVARVDGLVGVFSPRRDRYTAAFGPGLLVRPLPANYGAIEPGLFSGELEQGEGTRTRDLRVEAGGLLAFVAQGHTAAPRFGSQLTLDLSTGAARLSGTISNLSELTLSDPVLLGPGAVLRISDLPPGGTQSVDLSLSTSRATPLVSTSVSGVLPAGVPPIAAGPVPPYYTAYDTTVDDIFANTNYYEDREAYRKYSLLRAVVNPYGTGGGRGSGVYLVGWSDGSPVAVELEGEAFHTQDVTAYIVALRPELALSGGRTVLPPGLFGWSVADPGQQGSPSPYDMYVYQGTYALRFTLLHPVSYQSVESLTLHLRSYGTQGPVPLGVAVWDFDEGDWSSVAAPEWGDIALEDPARFVGPGGEVRLRIENANPSNSVSIESADFTLVVNR